MKLVVFELNNRSILGEVVGDTVYGLAWPDSNTRQLIRRGITPTRTYERFALRDITIKSPINPGKIIAVGRNYADHAAETGSKLPETPLLFAKLPSAIIAQNETITWRTSVTTQVDWEVELAVIIGKTAKNVNESKALDYVFGYTIANDVTARDLQRREQPWLLAKGLDTFCPLGPYLITKDEFPDPQNVNLSCAVNGDVVQNANTKDMVFGVAHLIAYISRMVTLEPGDVLLTGTPSGTGIGMTPERYLQDGDIVTSTIAEIGTLTNPCKGIADAE